MKVEIESKMRYFVQVALLYILSSSIFVIAADGDELTPASEDRWFQVELIIFENKELETDSPETWPTYPNIEAPATFIKIEGTSEIITSNSETQIDEDSDIEADTLSVEVEAPPSDKGLQGFVALSQFELKLTDERDALETKNNFRILYHEAWNQAVPNRDNVIPIKVNGGERYGRQSELQGFIKLYVETYLHFSTDLHLIEYKKSTDPFSVIEDTSRTDSASDTIQIFGGLTLLNADSILNNKISRKSNQFFIATSSAQLKESRKMYSGQIHYLDNPRFGLIILITPLKFD